MASREVRIAAEDLRSLVGANYLTSNVIDSFTATLERVPPGMLVTATYAYDSLLPDAATFLDERCLQGIYRTLWPVLVGATKTSTT